MKQKLHFHFEALMHSYAQVFFSQNKLLALLIMVVTFLKPMVGIVAFSSVVIANVVVYFSGYQLKSIREGMYGFNTLLLVVALSNMFYFNSAFVVLILVAILIVTITTISLNHFFERHLLPAVSIPFFLSYWAIKLAAPAFKGLEVNLDDVYWLNTMHKLGGWDLIDLYTYFENLPIPLFFITYFKSLGSVFFMPYVFAGLLIAIGIFIFSRIAFSISLLAYLVAWKGCLLFGYNQENLIYALTGSNIIFTAIGLGCFYLVPSTASYLLTIILVPVTLLVCNTFAAILEPWNLPAMTMPFAFVTVLTLHALRMRWVHPFLKFVDVQYYSPERVVYKAQNIAERFSNVFPIQMQLPVMGKWFVSQAYSGNITHKGAYDKAIDFVIVDDVDNKTFGGDGVDLENYYCFSKPVFAPAAGYVVAVENNVEDNKISDVNLVQNWGNSVVIAHSEGVYSQLSHLKNESIKVAFGDYVRAGDMIATCGSSGRSPEPHLHYQIQSSATVGATTIKYPFAYYIESKNGNKQFRQFEVPNAGDKVESVQTNKLLVDAFYFIPGKKLIFNVVQENQSTLVNWEVFTDSLNRTYIFCHSSQSTAYFVNDGTLFYFTDFVGDKKSLLFYFYLGCYKVLLAFYQDLKIHDSIPSDIFNNKLIQPIQDFCAPFIKFVQANYTVNYAFVDDVFSSNRIELTTSVDTHTGNLVWRELNFKLIIENGKLSGFKAVSNAKTIIEATCIS